MTSSTTSTTPRSPRLLVIFDTNVLYTQVASDLVRNEVSEVIEQNSSHDDLRLEWYLPNVVIEERRYQMRTKAYDLLPNLQKLERLLNHNLAITPDILDSRVDAAIDENLRRLKIKNVDLDTKKVDWGAIINRAVCRKPPFQPGDKEKGFRDSIIAESFLQLVEASPITPSACRIAFVTNDERLSDYIRARTADRKNVRVLSGIDELESLINTLVSEVTEEFVSKIKDKAAKFFFETDDDSCFYKKENLRLTIRNSCKDELEELPEGATRREDVMWWISPPIFSRKEKQRIHWITPIRVETKYFKLGPLGSPPTGPATGLTIGNESARQFPPATGPTTGLTSGLTTGLTTGLTSGLTGGLTPGGEIARQNYLSGLLGMQVTEVPGGTGESRIEVHWSVHVTQRMKLSHPRVEEIRAIGNAWEPADS